MPSHFQGSPVGTPGWALAAGKERESERVESLEVPENLKLSSDSAGASRALRYREKFENLENGTAISVAVCAKAGPLVPCADTTYVRNHGAVKLNGITCVARHFLCSDGFHRLPGVRLCRASGFRYSSSPFSTPLDITIFRALPL